MLKNHIPYILARLLQIDLDPDPAYHFGADPDPDPAFQFDADLCWFGFRNSGGNPRNEGVSTGH